jgi:hypothetical protein
MTALPQPPWTPSTTRRWSAGRIVALVLGICLLLPGLGLLAGGGALLWVDRADRDTRAFLNSTEQSFATPGYALASGKIDLVTGATWLPVSAALGTVELRVTGTGSSPVFAGIASVKDATAYLAGVRHTVITDLGVDSSGSGTLVPGGAPAGAPGDQTFWVSKVSGDGNQRLSWSPGSGNWMLVVMNADASAGVAVQAGVGATVPALSTLAWSLLGAGLLISVVGVLFIVLASRSRAASPGTPAGGWAVPAPRPGETAPSWGPPVPADPTRRVEGS